MHLTRKKANIRLPINRKGTKYIARASSHLNNSVPVVIAVRDMLKLARTANEVKKMIQQKILKINGRTVRDYRESILLFNILEVDKAYELSLLPTKKFVFVQAKNNQRLCKVVNRHLIKNGIFQLNLHDGTNVLAKEKINVGDSIYLDTNGKIKDHIALEKGRESLVVSGKYAGKKAVIFSMNGKLARISINGGSAEVSANAVVAI